MGPFLDFFRYSFIVNDLRERDIVRLARQIVNDLIRMRDAKLQ